MPVVMSLRASIETVKAVPNVAVFSTACWRQLQFFDALGSQCQANQSAGMSGHEIDGLRGHLFCGNDEIAFVFPVFVVDQDDELPLLNVPDGVFDIVERLCHK